MRAIRRALVLRPSPGRKSLAKGQMRSNREQKKPKADKKKSAKPASVYAAASPNKKKPG
jgi:hypothetical protein